ncbi:hypothetical protein ACS0TY_034198 [Phlomoides rotata]
MIISKFKEIRHLSHHLSRRRFADSAAAAVRHDTTIWTPTPLIKVSPSAESLFFITVDVSKSPDLAASYTKPGQYLLVRPRDRCVGPTVLAISSPPSIASSRGVFEFLVRSIAGSTAELLCQLQKGDVVELSSAIGNGFDVDRISPPDKYQTVLIFATGSGISPIRSLIETGFGADKRADVRLYYGARNLNRMAYQERFEDWQSSGVNIVPVLSRPDDSWTGERGYVQAAFARRKRILTPMSTGAVLCGRRQMAEVCSSFFGQFSIE